MKGTLELQNPIKIDGKTVKKLNYDLDEITPELFAIAEAKKNSASSREAKGMSKALELDYSFHMYLGMAAVIAVNDSYSMEDLERIKGHDIYEITKIGRSFLSVSEESSQEETSDEQLETMRESTTKA